MRFRVAKPHRRTRRIDKKARPVQHQSTDEVLRPGRWGCYSGVDGQRGNIRAHSREYRLRYHSGVDGQREATGGWARRCERFTSGKPTFAVERDPVGNTRNRRKSVRYSAGSKSARRCRGASRYQSRRKLTHHSAGLNSTTSDCCFRSKQRRSTSASLSSMSSSARNVSRLGTKTCPLRQRIGSPVVESSNASPPSVCQSSPSCDQTSFKQHGKSGQ
jgi:hypothetical protein